MLAVEYETGRLKRFIHLIECTVLVGAAGELLRKVDARIRRGRGARTACGPEILELGFQNENPASRQVRQGLRSFSFGLRASELQAQVTLLRRGTPKAVAHGTDIRDIRVRSGIQSVQTARELGHLSLSLPQKIEEDGCDLQRLVTCALAGLVGLSHTVELLQRAEGSFLGQEELAGGHCRFAVGSDHGGVSLGGLPQSTSWFQAAIRRCLGFVSKAGIRDRLDHVPCQAFPCEPLAQLPKRGNHSVVKVVRGEPGV
ncbi:hypothetical protein ACFTXM_39740 [Streptomyces sp. NPDC056930]|uniref:hypothetical protein n=1 Tax=Streptomyces sp. NPDC056930 TaxID=3345967 RepID=UPI00363636BA